VRRIVLPSERRPSISSHDWRRADRVEADRRLVEEDDLGVVEEPARDVQTLLHAARVALGALVLAALEADQFEELFDARLLDLRGHAVELCEVAQVVVAREPFVDAALAAEDVADALPDLARVLDDVVAEDAGVPRGRDQERDQHLDRRRLAGAVRPEQAEKLALLDLEADALDCFDLFDPAADRAGVRLVDAAQVVCLDDGHGFQPTDGSDGLLLRRWDWSFLSGCAATTASFACRSRGTRSPRAGAGACSASTFHSSTSSAFPSSRRPSTTRARATRP
jgi:hypothetical protein